MRILHIAAELRPSGLETMLRAASGFWQARGIHAEILAIGQRPGNYAIPLQQAGYQVHHLRFRRSPGLLIDVFRFLRTYQFDEVHIHSERANFWYALIAYLAGCRRIVRSVHNTFRFRGSLRARRWLQRGIMRWFLGVRSVAVSPSVRNAEWETYRNPSEAMLNWYDEVRFCVPSTAERQDARRAFGIAGGTLVVLTVGNCSEIKNHAAVVGAIARITPPLDVIYLHAGCEDEMPTEQRLAAELGLGERVRFLGPVIDILPLLRAADLFVMPSRYEGLGNAALEAMGAGVPVILADVDGLRDLRGFAPHAEWVEPEADAIAAAILRISGLAENERRSIGRSLSDAVREHCCVQIGAGRYASLYEEMLRT